MSTNKYFLKQFYAIYSLGDHLCIGSPKTDYFIKFRFDEHLKVLVDNLLNNGIYINEISTNRFYKELLEKNMLIEMSSAQNNEPDRSRLFFDYLNVNYPSELDLNSKILIFGAGAGGSTILYLLAQFGFKNLTIIDKDIVNKSDVQKTLIFRENNIGKSKVDCLFDIIKSNFNIAIKAINEFIITEPDLRDIIEIEAPVLIIKACDPDLNFRIFLNDICFVKKIPFLHMSYSYERITVGPFFIPGKTACDQSVNTLMKKEYGDDFDFLNTQKLYTNYSTHPSISFNINILASLILKDIIFYFAKKEEMISSLNALIYFFPLSMQSYKYTLECDKYCKTCGTVKKSFFKWQ